MSEPIKETEMKPITIVWPPDETFDYVVGLEDIEKNKKYFDELGEITIQLVPDREEKDREEKDRTE